MSSTSPSRMRAPATVPALLLAVSLVAGALAGCQALGGTAGVMPETEVGLPPSMRGAIPNRTARTAAVDEEGRPLQTQPTRSLAIPKTAGTATRSADAGQRQIRRDEIEGNDGRSGGASGAMAPALTPGGSVGLGGKF